MESDVITFTREQTLGIIRTIESDNEIQKEVTIGFLKHKLEKNNTEAEDGPK